MSTSIIGKMNVSDFLAWCELPENDGKSFELDCGEVIEMSRPGPKHGLTSWLVGLILGQYLLSGKPGYVLTNDTGLHISEDTLRGPDAMFFAEEPSQAGLDMPYCDQVPLLCVEVLSLSNSATEMVTKVSQYFARGVRLVWIIDPENRTVRVLRPDELPKLLDENDTLTGNGVLPEFSCAVADLFRLRRPN